MMIGGYLFLFILGLQIGSFINAFNYRLYAGESVWRGRSHCPECQHILGWKDLIPLWSFLVLRGRCRYCQKAISWHYPLVELGAGLLLPVIFFFATTNIEAIFYSLIFLILFTIASFDLKYYLIPDSLLLISLGTSLLFLSWQSYQIWGKLSGPIFISGLIAGITGFAFLGLVYWLTRGRGIGFGDVKLIFVIGIIVGWPNIVVAIFLSFFIGAIIGLALVGLGHKSIKTAIPFGPFLFLGGLMAVFWGAQIVSWYLSFFIK
jgi:leader peptidase (prepilin peptidase) / N-methyltransferase